jgi:hypothetical protein
MAAPELTGAFVDMSEKTFAGSRDEFVRYEYFISFLLYAGESILQAYEQQPDWSKSVDDEIGWHKIYLASDYFQPYLSTTSPRMRTLVEDLRSRAKGPSEK